MHLCDKHVVKMVLETAQMLCSVRWLQGLEAPYKLAHAKHPCTLWAGRSKENYLWLISHGIALAEEYTARYGKQHASLSVIEFCQQGINDLSFLSNGLTEFAQAMPDAYKNPDDVCLAYQSYLRAEKQSFSKWEKCPEHKPSWW